MPTFLVHLAAAVMVMAAAVMPTASARAEHESGAEDHGDDEYDACDDADPRGGNVHPDPSAPPPWSTSCVSTTVGAASVVPTGPVTGSSEDVVSLMFTMTASAVMNQ